MTAPAGYRDSEKYHTFPLNRVVVVELETSTRTKEGPSAFDASSANWTIYLRMAPYPLVVPTTYDFNDDMTKIVGRSAAGDTCRCSVEVKLTTAREMLHCEWVAADTNVIDATTPSGKKEYALDLPWIARAIVSPAPA